MTVATATEKWFGKFVNQHIYSLLQYNTLVAVMGLK
jgi:hypothetical protein